LDEEDSQRNVFLEESLLSSNHLIGRSSIKKYLAFKTAKKKKEMEQKTRFPLSPIEMLPI